MICIDNRGILNPLLERKETAMRVTRTVVRAAAPVVAALFTVGLMSSAAWASPAAPDAPPPPHITAKQCTVAKGRVVVDSHDHRTKRCVGGRLNGRLVA
jgi:hypothetical protein